MFQPKFKYSRRSSECHPKFLIVSGRTSPLKMDQEEEEEKLYDTATPLDILFQSVPNMERACSRNQIYSQQSYKRSNSNFILKQNQSKQSATTVIIKKHFRQISQETFQTNKLEETIQFRSSQSRPIDQEILEKIQSYSRMASRKAKNTIVYPKFTADDFIQQSNQINNAENSIQNNMQFPNKLSNITKQSFIDYETISKETFITECYKTQQRLIEAVKLHNLIDNANIFEEFLIESVKTKNSLYLAHSLFFCGAISKRFQKLPIAIYFFDQCGIICAYNLKLLIKLKLDCLINLGQCSRDLQIFDYAIQLYKKALQYSWFLNQRDKENMIYDSLGNLKKSLYYNGRAVKDRYEADNSNLKKLSNDLVKEKLARKHEISHPQIISQPLIHQLDLVFILKSSQKSNEIDCELKNKIQNELKNEINNVKTEIKSEIKSEIRNETLFKNQKKHQKVSVYANYFKSEKLSIGGASTNNLRSQNNNFKSLDCQQLINLEINPQKMLERILKEREYSFTLQTPPLSDTEDNPILKKQYFCLYNSIIRSGRFIYGRDTFFSSRHWNPGPLDIKNKETKNPKLYRMSLDQKIQYRQEQLEESQQKPIGLLKNFMDLNQQVCKSHLSLKRGQLMITGGQTVKDLIKVIEQEYSFLLKSLQ